MVKLSKKNKTKEERSVVYYFFVTAAIFGLTLLSFLTFTFFNAHNLYYRHDFNVMLNSTSLLFLFFIGMFILGVGLQFYVRPRNVFMILLPVVLVNFIILLGVFINVSFAVIYLISFGQNLLILLPYFIGVLLVEYVYFDSNVYNENKTFSENLYSVFNSEQVGKIQNVLPKKHGIKKVENKPEDKKQIVKNLKNEATDLIKSLDDAEVIDGIVFDEDGDMFFDEIVDLGDTVAVEIFTSERKVVDKIVPEENNVKKEELQQELLGMLKVKEEEMVETEEEIISENDAADDNVSEVYEDLDDEDKTWKWVKETEEEPAVEKKELAEEDKLDDEVALKVYEILDASNIAEKNDKKSSSNKIQDNYNKGLKEIKTTLQKMLTEKGVIEEKVYFELFDDENMWVAGSFLQELIDEDFIIVDGGEIVLA